MQPIDPFRHRGPVGFRLAHELEGLLTGIRSDGVIAPDEQRRIRDWLDENRQFDDVRPFSELAARLDAALADGTLTVDECDDLLFVVSKLTTVNPYFDALRTGLQVLMGLLAGVTADGTLTEDEARSLLGWTQDWTHLKGLWPYDECEAIVSMMLNRNRVAEYAEHLRALTAQFPVAGIVNETTGEVPPLLVRGVCALEPDVRFPDRDFTFTGESATRSRAEMWALVEELGGRPSDSVTRRTDYLVVCDGGSPFWAFSCYGRKVEKAYSMRRAGHAITIVHETDFWDAAAGYAGV